MTKTRKQKKPEGSTKVKILHDSTILFAKRGYAAVSMKDITRQVGIKPSSFYNHYVSKEDLWNSVMSQVEERYKSYFAHLEQQLQNASTFREILGTMLAELKKVVDIYNYYGFSLVINEQVRDRKAAEIFNNIFLDFSISYLSRYMDQCIERGLVKSFDTRTVSTMIMHSVLVNNHLRVHEDMGLEIPYDVSEMWTSFERFILGAVE